MAITDFILAPIYLILFYSIAFIVRPYVTNKDTKQFFMSALSFKLIGSIAFVLIFVFYYGGGDTTQYYRHSNNIFQAFFESPKIYLKLLFSHGEYDPETISYVSRRWMYWYRSPSEFFVAKVSAVFALIGFNSYTVISLFFALYSFSGLWALYNVLYKINPTLKKEFAIAVFFIPSTFFWGSGLMKDSLCMGAIGWMVFSFYNIFLLRKNITSSIILGLISVWALSIMKLYIILCLLPAMVFWVFLEYSATIKSKLTRMALKPFFLIIGGAGGFLLMTNLAAGDKKYDIEKLGETAQVTADYLYETSVRQDGSAYSIGELDGTLGGMVKLAPQAIVVALFRPFLWEVKNPVMLLSALESMWFTFFTLSIFFKAGIGNFFKTIGKTPFLVFCFIFSLVFAFAVGSTSFNFGTLVRYKIPLIPFYVAGLYMLRHILQTSNTGRYKRKRAVA